MRVLHVVSNISLGNGIMSVLMNYYRNLDRNKVQFDFFFYDSRKTTYADEIVELGGKVIEMPNIRNPFKFRRSYSIFCKNRKGHYNIIHIHDCFMSFFICDIKRNLGAQKLIIHSHNPKLSDYMLGEIRNRILSYPSYFIADYYFACSKESGFYAFGAKFNKGTILNNAIDVRNYRYNAIERVRIREELGINGKFVIGNIAGFRKQKNHRFMIDIFSELLSREHESVMVLVGSGPTMNEIKEIARDKDIYDKILFLGTRSDIDVLLSAFDVFLLPSIYEGFGIVLVEAQAEGLPCVFSDTIPVMANILKNNNTVLELADNPKKWADALISRGKKGRVENTEIIDKTIEEAGFNISVEAIKLQKLYEDMICNNGE